MSRKLHIYCYNEWEVSTIDALLSYVSWWSCSHGGHSLLGFALLLLSSELPIKATGFTKNNYLMSCIRYTNALHAVIIFIIKSKCIEVYEGFRNSV